MNCFQKSVTLEITNSCNDQKSVYGYIKDKLQFPSLASNQFSTDLSTMQSSSTKDYKLRIKTNDESKFCIFIHPFSDLKTLKSQIISAYAKYFPDRPKIQITRLADAQNFEIFEKFDDSITVAEMFVDNDVVNVTTKFEKSATRDFIITKDPKSVETSSKKSKKRKDREEENLTEKDEGGEEKKKTEAKATIYTCLTWNVCASSYSFHARKDWTLDQNHAAIWKEIEDSGAEILALQETSDDFLSRMPLQYILIAMIESHMGYIALCIATKLRDHVRCFKLFKRGIILHFNDGFSFAGCHLPPGTIGEVQRLNYFETLEENSAQKAVIAGDYNARKTEEYVMKDGKELKIQEYTYNSYANPFYNTGHQITARFDRVFFRGVEVVGYRLIGVREVGPKHYLSDHFGIYFAIQC